MAFHGYTPQAKSYTGIGQAIGQIGAAVGVAGQEIETKRAAAVKAAENWEDMEYAIKGIRKNYTNYGQKLVDSGAVTQETYQAGLDQLSMPTRADQKNPEAYIIKMEERVANAYKIFAGKEDILLKQQAAGARQQQIGGAVRGAMAGATQEPLQEEQFATGKEPLQAPPMTIQPPTEERAEIAKRIPAQIGATTKELEAVPEYEEALTPQQQARKEKEAQAPQIQKQKEERELKDAKELARYKETLKKQGKKAEDVISSAEALKGYTAVQTRINANKKTIMSYKLMAKEADDPTSYEIEMAQLEKKNKELEDVAKALKETFIKSKDVSQRLTPQEQITEKFGYLPPDEMSRIMDGLKLANPATPGKRWTIDDLFEAYQARKQVGG